MAIKLFYVNNKVKFNVYMFLESPKSNMIPIIDFLKRKDFFFFFHIWNGLYNEFKRNKTKISMKSFLVKLNIHLII